MHTFVVSTKTRKRNTALAAEMEVDTLIGANLSSQELGHRAAAAASGVDSEMVSPYARPRGLESIDRGDGVSRKVQPLGIIGLAEGREKRNGDRDVYPWFFTLGVLDSEV